MKKNEIRPLTGLRGVAALWVLAHHCLKLAADIDPYARLPLSLLGKAGYLGVDIFFVLSGFVLAYSYASMEINWNNYSRFLWKRIARIYPVHIAVLAIFAATLGFRTVDTDLSMIGLLRTLTLTHAWDIPIEKIWHSVSWSISAEWAAYLAFPLIAAVTERSSLRGAIISIGALFAALAVVLSLSPWPETFVYGMPRIAAEFTAGVLVYRIWRKRRHAVNLLTLSALLLMIGGGNFLDLLSGMGTSMFVMPSLACLIVYGLACASGPIASAFVRIERLGHISYALYLVHMIPIGMAQWALPKFGLSTDVAAVYVVIGVCAALSLLAADLLYRYVEQPARARMLQLASVPRPVVR